MKNTKLYLLMGCLLFILSSCGERSGKASYEIVPKIQHISYSEGEGFELNSKTPIIFSEKSDNMQQIASFLSDYIVDCTGIKLSLNHSENTPNGIFLNLDKHSDNLEAYDLVVDEEKITISGASEAGLFYGIQALRKFLPIDSKLTSVKFPAVTISDFPRFPYRGMHLDVSRHMFSTDSIKIYIDMLAMHNINRFHWHLTDDQGWRVEIKKYPELIEIGSKREQTVIGKNSGEYDGQPYGGYYTQEEIKDIVQYAQDRFITIIPEVDLPGHMLAALTTYPNLGCTGGPYKVAQSWGVFDDVLCAGNEEIYPFLEGVFDEIIELFPSEYIHIGGDECPKVRWKACPKCQAKIKELNLKTDKEHTAEEKLQSYVIQRMEQYINSKGRKIIGWDEILEGGIAPNATILSWRGTEGGITAARQGHDAIMVPTSYLYFDYYQTEDLKGEKLGIGGYVPVEKVYHYDPVPEVLNTEEQKHIIGTQANLWAEYIKDFSHAQYMTLPRMAALSEVQWTLPEQKDYQDFLLRLANYTKLYDLYEYNYATHVFNIKDKYEVDEANKKAYLSLSTFDDAAIYYTTDGTEPNNKSLLYSDPLEITTTTQIKAVALREDGSLNSKVYEKSIDINKATFKPISLELAPWDSYTYKGASVMVDGQLGADVFANGSWIGFDSDCIATVDLEETTEISSVSIGVFIDTTSWLFGFEELKVETSLDGTSFKEIYSQTFEPVSDGLTIAPMRQEAVFEKTDARYVKITAKRLRSQPEWASGAGQTAHLFIDEIQIY